MPIKLQNLDAGLGVAFIGDGIVTGEEIIHANEKVLAFGNKIRVSKYCIIDYTDVAKYEVSRSEIERIAAQDKAISEYLPEYIVAIIGKTNLEFGVSRMWEAIVKINGLLWDTMIFRDRDEADAWIKEKVKLKHNIEVAVA